MITCYSESPDIKKKTFPGSLPIKMNSALGERISCYSKHSLGKIGYFNGYITLH